MHKKRLKFLLILPLLLINFFNVLFIILNAKGRGYLREACQAVIDYFIGFHLIPLVLVIVIMFLFYYFKKLPRSSVLYQLFLVFLLFSIAINSSLFPEINEWFGLRGYDFKRKKTSSLNEAISKSSASFTKLMRSYIKMNKYLNNKTLIIPISIPLEEDYFFKVFVTPNKILKEDYSYKLLDEDYRLLKNYPIGTFVAYGIYKGIKRFILTDAFLESEKFILFTYEENFIFLPSGFINQHNLNVHD